MYGNDYEYARTRLNGTVVRHAGQPVFIIEIDADCVCTAQHIDSGENFTADLEEFDLTPVPLGWCNIPNGQAVYLQRVPLRRDWKQGLRKENMHAAFGNLNRINYKHIKACILGEYPTLASAIAKAKKYGLSTAWRRHWAISTDGVSVLYKDYDSPVGEIVDGQIVLLQKYSYLETCLLSESC